MPAEIMNAEELEYFPVSGDAPSIATSLAPNRVLVVGERIFVGAENANDLRMIARSDVRLPTGVYAFAIDDGTSLMAVLDGADPGAPQRGRWSDGDDNPLKRAFGWFEHWWQEAASVPKPQFEVGSPVVRELEQTEGTVRSRQFEHGKWWYRVRVQGQSIECTESDLASPEFDDDPESWITRTPEESGRLAATVTRAKLTEQLTDTVYSFRASRTVFRPYQFRPVLKLLESGHLRILIADEVGLGKTIEAGLLWTELDARSQANRVLIVTPSGLVSKWKFEMEDRFGYVLAELSRPDLDDMLARFEQDRFHTRFHGIVSVERLRTWEGLERLSELGPRFDLIIADEAHVFRNSGTRSYELGSLLSDLADAYVFLSATPLNLGNDDLFNLLELLSPGEFDDRNVLEQRLEPNAVLNQVSASLMDRHVTPKDRLRMLTALDSMVFGSVIKQRPEFHDLAQLLKGHLSAADVVEARRLIRRLHALESVVTRTRKIEIQEHKAVREPHPINVEWTPQEADLYRKYEEWQQRRARSKGIPSGFATQMPMRLASTCLPAARDQILQRAAGRTDFDFGIELEEEFEENEIDPILWASDVPPDEVVRAAQRLGTVDSKFEAFQRHLVDIVQTGRQVLVFSFSRPTLAYLLKRLEPIVRVNVLHGGIDRSERSQIISRFREGEFDVLLASKVASEGLDFEFCSAVVNYDLPWNPMEVEQRIGRIDRFGQKEEKILIFNFHTPGTIETDIVERLHQRIGVFESSIGELEPVLRRAMDDIKNVIFDYTLTDDQRRQRLDEQLAAIEEQKAALEDVERAAAILTSTDRAEIDGLERDLITSGKYVGQRELVHLLSTWISRTPAARMRISEDGNVLFITGSPELADDLRQVQTAGERSSAELENLIQKLRNGLEFHVSLDQEHARRTGSTLLTATHPLVRAAIIRSTFANTRYGAVRLRDTGLPEGHHLVYISLARWKGVQPSVEMWTSSYNIDELTESSEVGDRLLAALADGSWHPSSIQAANRQKALELAISQTRSRRMTEEARRKVRNDSLVETRRLSIQETFLRKRNVIERRIATAESNNSLTAVRLQRSQLAMQDRLQQQAEEALENRRQVSMEVEPLAVVVVEVRP